jgi:lysyl-tRNA synthetase class 2
MKRISEFEMCQEGDICEMRGRVIFRRDFGKLCFAKLYDFYGEAQISVSVEFCENIPLFKRGDFLYVKGFVTFSKRGEKTLQVQEMQILNKSHKDLPDKWCGLKDETKVQTLRYVNTIINDDVRSIFKYRFKVLRKIQEYFENLGLQQVETPILCPVASGAAANPFVTHHDALDVQMFLRIAPELYLKRYMATGLQGAFEIAKCFRNEGIDTTHLQEFTMVEAYQSYISYEDLIQMAIGLLQAVVGVFSEDLVWNGLNFNDFQRISYTEFIRKYVGIEPEDWFNEPKLRQIAHENNINISGCKSTMAMLDKLYKKMGLCNIHQPTVIYDYYKSPLALESTEDSRLSKQFQVIICQREVIKACLEMIDPEKQLKNFLDQIELSKTGELDVVRIDYSYIEALEYGVPPMGGLGMGIDRIMTILTGSDSIEDIIMFTQTRPQHKS